MNALSPSLLWHIVLMLQIVAMFSTFNTAIYCIAQRRLTAATGLALIVGYLVLAGVRVASQPTLEPAPDYVFALIGVTVLSFTLAKRRARVAQEVSNGLPTESR